MGRWLSEPPTRDKNIGQRRNSPRANSCKPGPRGSRPCNSSKSEKDWRFRFPRSDGFLASARAIFSCRVTAVSFRATVGEKRPLSSAGLRNSKVLPMLESNDSAVAVSSPRFAGIANVPSRAACITPAATRPRQLKPSKDRRLKEDPVSAMLSPRMSPQFEKKLS